MVQVVLVKRLPKHTQSGQLRLAARGPERRAATLRPRAGRDQARTRAGRGGRAGARFPLLTLGQNRRLLWAPVSLPRLKWISTRHNML